MPGTVPSDQLSPISATNIDMSAFAAGCIYNNAGTVSVIAIGTGLQLASSVLSCTIPGQVNSDWNASSGLAQILNKPNVNTASFTQGVSHSFVTTTSSTGFQVSSTRNSIVHYTVTVSTSATIGGAAAGLIFLEIAATNSVTPSDWTVVSEVGNSQTITLAIALQSIQAVTGPISGLIPAGYYVRLRTSNVSGTPTFTYVTGQEVLL